MTDLEFLRVGEALLAQLEAECDRINEHTDADVDNQRAGAMLTLTFRNRSQVVVNLQKPLHEVWLAARSGGFHYRHVDGQWRDTKTQELFWQRLTQSACEQSGLALALGA